MSVKVSTCQVGDRLFIVNGQDEIKYLDLASNEVVVFKPVVEHTHNWLYGSHHRYRSIDRTEYVQENYTCECGAGHFERIRIPTQIPVGYVKSESVITVRFN